MAIIRRYGETDFITGLRAIAATMVVVIHTGAFRDFGWLGINVTEVGKHGVEMFFVISGFTIASTFLGGVGYRHYLIRRLFRIAPLYWFLNGLVAVLILAAVLPPTHWMETYDTKIDAYNLFMHFSFLSFLDYRVATSLIGVEWTIPVEVFWYIFLPLLIIRCRRPRHFAIALLCLWLLALLTREAADVIGQPMAARWFPTNYGPYFVIGMIGYALRQSMPLSDWKFRKPALLASFGLFVWCIAFDPDSVGTYIGLSTGAIIALYRSEGRRGLLSSRPLLFIGSISYSIYLWHFILIMFVNHYISEKSVPHGLAGFVVIYGLTLALSTLTYLLIERPTNRLGTRAAQWVDTVWPRPIGQAGLYQDR